jgi:hypothetical protein
MAVKGGIMGRFKKELKRIHARKVKKAKKKLRLYLKKELAFEKLTVRARHFLEKQKKAKAKAS